MDNLVVRDNGGQLLRDGIRKINYSIRCKMCIRDSFDAAITAMYGWEPTKSGGPTAGSEQVTNRTDEAASDWIHVPGFGRLTYPELEHYVDTGAIIESYDERTGKYTYRKA